MTQFSLLQAQPMPFAIEIRDPSNGRQLLRIGSDGSVTGELADAGPAAAIFVDSIRHLIQPQSPGSTGAEPQYQVGSLTMEHVFRSAGLVNLSDMQAVLDAMEAALAARPAGQPA